MNGIRTTTLRTDIRTAKGVMRIRKFPANAKYFAPTPDTYAINGAELRTITHLGTGLCMGAGLEARQAQLLATIADQLLPTEKLDGVLAGFLALPPEIQKWLKGWVHDVEAASGEKRQRRSHKLRQRGSSHVL